MGVWKIWYQPVIRSGWTDPSGFDKISSDKVTATVESINNALKDKPVDSKGRQKLNYTRKHWPAALDRYEQQEKKLGGQRNSYSKTDEDATFMQMKEDHMKKRPAETRL